MSDTDKTDEIVIGLIVGCALIFIVAISMVAWIQIDYNTKLITIESQCWTTATNAQDCALYDKYHK